MFPSTRHSARGASLQWCGADAGSARSKPHHVPVSATHRIERGVAHGMTGVLPAIAFAIICWPAPARAETAAIKGTFIGPGTYATTEGCQKLAAITAGGDQNVETVPEKLTEDGFEGWEGSCTFKSFTEVEKGKKWKALLHCADGPEEGPESDIFERLPDGSLKVTVMDNATIFQRCDAGKGK